MSQQTQMEQITRVDIKPSHFQTVSKPVSASIPIIHIQSSLNAGTRPIFRILPSVNQGTKPIIQIKAPIKVDNKPIIIIPTTKQNMPTIPTISSNPELT